MTRPSRAGKLRDDYLGWGIKRTSGPRFIDVVLQGDYSAAMRGEPEMRGHRTMVFNTRREARDYCRVQSIRRNTRSDKFFWVLTPIRVRVTVEEA